MSSYRPRNSALLALLGAATFTFVPGLAAQRSTTEMGGRARELGGHRFVPNRTLPDPFLASRFGTSIGFGGARNLDVPIYNAADSLVDVLTGDLGFLAIDFEYQQQVTSWLALRASAGAIARSGTDAFSFAAEGISTVYGYGLGATGRIWGNDRLQLSGVLEYSGNAVYGVQPLTYLQGITRDVRQSVDDVLAGGGTIDSATIDSIIRSIDLSQYDVIAQGSTNRTSVGLRLAYAVAPWLGFTVATQSGAGRLFRASNDLGIIDVGAAASIDVGALWKVPLGISLAGRYQNFNERASDIATDLTTFSTFISYAARRDLALGVELTNSSISQPTGGVLRTSRAAVNMTYYF